MNFAIETLVGLVFGVGIGMTLGAVSKEKSLTLAPDRDGVCGCHKLNGRFWYLVPESLWVRVSLRSLRHDGDHADNAPKTK